MKFHPWSIGLMVLLVVWLTSYPVLAQDNPPPGPVYIVQEGDSLWDIAVRFGVSLQELQKINDISDPSQISVGSRLVIPGLEGMQGVLTTSTVAYGETLRSLMFRYQMTLDQLIRLNHLTSPAEIYAGSTLVAPQQESPLVPAARSSLAEGQSVLECAMVQNINPWQIVLENQLSRSWQALPGEVMYRNVEGIGGGENAPWALPDEILSLRLAPLIVAQGKTAVLEITGTVTMSITGMLAEYPLHFLQQADGKYTALQGVHAMLEPGLYPLSLEGRLANGTPLAFSQSVLIASGDYLYDPVLTVSPETIDPAVTRPEDAQWAALAQPVTPQKYWEGQFQSPAPEIYADCWPSLFGSRRSYNGSDYSYFHTGLDFCGGVGTDILAPAAGVVIFVGPLTVRGNATMIDHGMGVYSGYMHQDEILVQVGDHVEPGQVIGKVGGTGRVTGPHLHWEIWVGGVQVDPMEWLQRVFP